MRRRALAVAAGILCAPALATMALATIGATSGGEGVGIGKLAGTHGLRGDASPVAPAPTAPVREARAEGKPVPVARKAQGEAPAPAPPAAQHPARPQPSPPPERAPKLPRSQTVTPPSYPSDPSQPGYPTGSYPNTTTGSGSGEGTSTTSDAGSDTSSGGPDGYYGYPGGG